MSDPLSVLVELTHARAVGSMFKARCPAHDDSSPSLSLRRGDSRAVVLYCFAGCETRDILDSLGLPSDFLTREDADASEGRPAPLNGAAPGHGVELALRTRRYEIRGLDGTLRAIHVREDLLNGRKKMAWLWPDGTASSQGRRIETKALPLYRSETLGPKLATGRPLAHVFVVEGEKSADALAALSPGTVVLGTVCGARATPEPVALEPLRDQTVILWPDKDLDGIDHMHRIGRALAGIAATVRVITPPDSLPDHGDAADFDGTWGDVLDLVVAAGPVPPPVVLAGPTPTYTSVLLPTGAEPAPEPETAPLSPEQRLGVASLAAETVREPDWPVLDDAAYHGPLGWITRAMEPYTEADPAGILASLLTMAGVALGRLRVLSIAGAGVQAPNLFTMLVGDSAVGRKGTAVSAAWSIMKRAEPDMDKIIVPGLGSGEGLIAHLRREVDRAASNPGSPAEYRVLVDESEMARLLTAMGREGSTLSAILRAAFDGTALGRAVVTSTGTVTWHHVGLLGQVTPTELRDKLALSERSNGFANRFLWVAVRQQRLAPLAKHPSSYVDDLLVGQLTAAIADAGTLSPVTMTPDAERAWVAMYTEVVTRQQTRASTLAGLTSREVVQLLRVATVYALLDRAPAVGVEHLVAARALVDYSIASARWIWRTTTGDADADAVLAALVAEGPIAWMDLRRDYGLRGGEADRVVELLRSGGLIEIYTEQSRGRPRRYIRIA